MQGRCLCGSVKFEIDLPVTACVTCHCESCRRQCSAPMTAYVGVKDGNWRWLSDIPASYASSPGVERCCCANCGTPLTLRSQKRSDTLHFCVASLERPQDFAPTLHVAFEEKLPWLHLNDGLPTCVGPDYTKA